MTVRERIKMATKRRHLIGANDYVNYGLIRGSISTWVILNALFAPFNNNLTNQ